jgi:predicted flap endonuclease-1-like 5' DNA nuclease
VIVKIEDIEGIGPAHGAKLTAAGVVTTDHLLERAASASGRTSLAAETGHSTAQLLERVNLVDLMRVDGVGAEYSDLLEATKLVRRVPSGTVVTGWIAEAKTMDKVVTH